MIEFKHKRWMLSAMAFASPVVLALLAPTIREHRGPASASAALPDVSQVADQNAAGDSISVELAPEQRAARAHLEGLKQLEPDAIPFLLPELEQDEPDAPTLDTVDQEERPDVRVSSIMSGARPIAVVNGRPMTVGQEVAEVWVLAEIDAAKGTVRFEHRFEPDRFFSIPLDRTLPNG